MKRAFVHMAHHMEHTVYTDIIQSDRYGAVDSVETLFELLAPYLKKPDCSLLSALVSVTNCDEAMQRLIYGSQAIKCLPNLSSNHVHHFLKIPQSLKVILLLKQIQIQ